MLWNKLKQFHFLKAIYSEKIQIILKLFSWPNEEQKKIFLILLSSLIV